MNQLLAIVRLDLALFVRDRKALILLYVVPVVMAAFFGQLAGGRGGKTERSAIAILLVDLDGSPASRGVLAAFTTDASFKVTITNEAVARDLVTAGKIPVGVILPAGFGENLLPGVFDTNRRPTLTLIYDPSRQTERAMIEGMLVPKLVQGVAENLFTVEHGRQLITQGLTNLAKATDLSEPRKKLLADSIRRADEFLATRSPAASASMKTGGNFELPLPYRVEAVALTKAEGAEYNGFAHSFGGMSLQFVLMAMIDLAIGLLTERRSGTFRRLRAAPLSRGTLLLGKAVSYSLIALSTFAFSFAVAMMAFGVRIGGSWAGFLLVIVTLCVFAATLAIALAALGKTPQATRGLAIPVVLILLMLGGAWIPSFVFPPWVRTVSMCIPTGWAMDALDAMTWRGLDFAAVLPPVGGLAAVTVVLALISWRSFRWEGD